jgi:hypothetical protein
MPVPKKPSCLRCGRRIPSWKRPVAAKSLGKCGPFRTRKATALFQERCQELLEGHRERMLFYVARCYRYERPQAGRYREFVQLGFEYLCPDPERALVRSRELAAGFLDSLVLLCHKTIRSKAIPGSIE